MKLLLGALVLFSVCFTDGAHGEKSETRPAQILGKLWNGILAHNPDAYAAYKAQILEIPVAIFNDCRAQLQRSESTVNISVMAMMLIESALLSEPQNFLLVMTGQQYAELKIGSNSSPLQWATAMLSVYAYQVASGKFPSKVEKLPQHSFSRWCAVDVALEKVAGGG